MIMVELYLVIITYIKKLVNLLQISFADISLRIIYLSKNLESNNETFKSYIIDNSLNFFSNY